MSIRIILADDHAIVRHGLSRSFQQEEDLEIIAEAEDGRSSVKLARELSPDVVVMDISERRYIHLNTHAITVIHLVELST